MSINKFTSTFQVLNMKTPILLMHGAMHASWKRVGDDNDDDNDYDDEYDNDSENDMNDNYEK